MFFRVIHLKQIDEKASTLALSLQENLKADGLWDLIVDTLVGLITDGASVCILTKLDQNFHALNFI